MKSKKHRVAALDLARAIAIFGMVIVHYNLIYGPSLSKNFEFVFHYLLQGRSAALFVILSGIGVSLFVRNTDSIASQKKVLFKRAMILFVTGLLFYTIWPADILHYYGVFILLSIPLLWVRSRWLLLIASCCVFIFTLLFLALNYDSGWNWETITYSNFWTKWGFTLNLFYNGFHPVFPWFSFFLTGLCIGRLDFSNKRIIYNFGIAGLVIYLLITFTSVFLIQTAKEFFPLIKQEDLSLLLGAKPMPPFPQYVISATGFFLFIISISIWLIDKFENIRFIKLLKKTGKLSLTIYISHVIIGMTILDKILIKGETTTITVILFSLFLMITAVLFTNIWSKFNKQGPLEFIIRKLT